MDPLLSGACRPLVEKTQAELAVTVTARLSPELPTGSQVLIQDMKQSGELVILLKPDRKDQQYLIALGCLNALAAGDKPFALRGNGKGEGEFAAELAQRGVEQAIQMAEYVTNGTARQLRGAPLQAMSAQLIYREYPDLRAEQKNYFILDCAEGAYALTNAPSHLEGTLLSAHQAMNGAMALVADYLFQDTEFYKPYRDTPTDPLATSLVEDLYGIEAPDAESEIITRWIDKLSLSNYFEVVYE